MNKYELAAAHRAQLEYWLILIEDAIRRRETKRDELLAASDGPISPPPLEIVVSSKDMERLLLKGLQNALLGKPDPFGIAEPKRGNRPKFDRQGWLDVVRKVLAEVERNKAQIDRDGSLAYGKRDAVSEAIATVAERYELSIDAVRHAYYDPDNWVAKLQGPEFNAD